MSRENGRPQTLDPSRGSYPQIALTILEQRSHGSVDALTLDCVPIARGNAEHSGGGCNPDVLLVVDGHGSRCGALQLRGNPRASDLGSVPDHQAGVGADPQIARAGREKDVDLPIRNTGDQTGRLAIDEAVQPRIPRTGPYLA